MKLRTTRRNEPIELQMTPMIDIVFQLLVFFIMTFKIVLPEGDFNIRMPPPASTDSTPPEFPTLKLRMTADTEGNLTGLQLGDEPLTGSNNLSPFDQLRLRIVAMASADAGPDASGIDNEVEIDADYELDYDHIIQAITAVSGYFKDGQRYKLVEKIRFAPPKEQ
jgi:biopolymer transport protein ExbD